MDQSQAIFRSDSPLGSLEDLGQQFMSQGYLVVPEVVDKSMLANIHAQISSAFDLAKAQGKLFSGGGTLSGHLNCFPGLAARSVYDVLEARGIIDTVRALSPRPLRMPNAGCNLNFPHSSEQNEHVDGYAATPFLVVNVAVVDTTLANGAMEILPRTHLREYKYWQLLASRPERVRLCMSAGDVVIRTSTLWHRGMPNRTERPRPMLAFTWEDGGSSLADPFAAQDGQIRFLPNRFRTDWAGRLRERVFVAAPGLSRAVRAATSLLTG
jgi:Phytanoyl-CoA dioxygenase (PhyH)